MLFVNGLIITLFLCGNIECRVTNENGTLKFAKYLYGTTPIWDDTEKNKIIADGSRSSKTITASDFMNIYPSSDSVALATTTFQASEFNEVIRLLLDKEYVMKLLFEESKHVDSFSSFKYLSGLNILPLRTECGTPEICKSKFEFLRRHYLLMK